MKSPVIAYGSLALAIIFEVTGSSLLQKSEQFSKLVPTVAMALAYTASLFFLSQALKSIPLGAAYAIWGGLGILLTAAISVFVFRFPLDAPALVGIVLIVSGVVVMNGFSHTMSH